jgi:hypothetical protein
VAVSPGKWTVPEARAKKQSFWGCLLDCVWSVHLVGPLAKAMTSKFLWVVALWPLAPSHERECAEGSPQILQHSLQQPLLTKRQGQCGSREHGKTTLEVFGVKNVIICLLMSELENMASSWSSEDMSIGLKSGTRAVTWA